MAKLLPSSLFLLLLAAEAPALTVTGRVVDRIGDPVPQASVVLEGVWLSTETDENGRFSFEVAERPTGVRVTAPTGESVRENVPDKPGADWRVELPVMVQAPVQLEDFVVLPSRFPVGEMAGAQMTSLEAVLTPGSLADVNRALQTLPGVDGADEGDALYVRGGEAQETGAFVNGSRYLQVRSQESPLGTFVGSIDPFVARSIRFEAGGFGAARGNLLSGVVDLETSGRPLLRETNFNVGLGAISGAVNLPLRGDRGVRISAMQRDVDPILSANGASRSFVREPWGHDFSVLFGQDFPVGGELRLFGLEQTERLALNTVERGQNDVYTAQQRRRQGFASVSWPSGTWQARADVSWGRQEQNEALSFWTWRQVVDHREVNARMSRSWSERAQTSVGVEGESNGQDFRERYEAETFTDALTTRRGALWLDHDAMVTERWRTQLGGRIEHSNWGGGTTVDPRLATGYRLRKGLDVSAAWGVYHQRPEELAHSTLRNGRPLSSQRARHHILALAWTDGEWQGRVEAYHKSYDRLWQITPERQVQAGDGWSRGVELSGKAPLLAQIKLRAALNVTEAERTDLRTGQRAPFGIPYTGTIVVQRAFDDGLQVGVTWRQSAGRRYTPVTGAQQGSSGEWSPRYGAPNSAHLRDLQRLDLLITKIHQLSSRTQMVTYLSVSNVLGRANQYEMGYSRDYREQTPVRSILNRIIYVGCTFSFR